MTTLHGFRVPSPCGREWFVPIEAVGHDYAEFLAQADGLSPDAAAAKAEENREWWPTWFAEQCNSWADIDRLGILSQSGAPIFKTKKALDRLRGRHRVEYAEVRF